MEGKEKNMSHRPNMRLAVVSLVLSALCGCVNITDLTSPLNSNITDDRLAVVDAMELCIDYNRSRDRRVLDELKSRNALNAEDLQALTARDVVIGMSKRGATCLYGLPDQIHDTTTASHRHEQWVYCSNYMLNPRLRPENMPGSWLTASNPLDHERMCGDRAYLYFDDNRLTAHQDTVQPIF